MIIHGHDNAPDADGVRPPERQRATDIVNLVKRCEGQHQPTPGPNAFSAHEYLTVRHFDRYLQIIELESEGPGAKNLTAKQIKFADQTTDALGDRWRASFR